ncbi:MAG: SlyX family protein [Asticcacaulis sp.]|nr:SlyX family protein [Asticcacaulis sp.]
MSTDANAEDRIVALEDQAKTIDELSDQLAEQWTTIDRMRRALERLGERLIGLEDRSGEAAPVTRPPHY